jgi:ATP-dependent DNA helicase RecG
LIELRMTSLVPAETLTELEERLGARFTALPELERMALVTALAEGMVSHARLREISTDHPADITKMLARLVKDGLLEPDGVGRGMVYFLPWMTRPSPTGFAGDQPEASVQDGSGPKQGSLTPELDRLTPELDRLTPELDLPLVIDESQLTPAEQATLRQTASPVSRRPRVRSEVMREVVVALCAGRFLGLRLLAALLNRKDFDSLRERVLNLLVQEGVLRRAFPRPNDPRQAYTSSPIQVADHTEPPK